MLSIQPGDRVAYSVQFLKSIGMSHSEMAQARGRCVGTLAIGSTTLAEVEWDNCGINLPGRVNIHNLAKVGANARFCQC